MKQLFSVLSILAVYAVLVPDAALAQRGGFGGGGIRAGGFGGMGGGFRGGFGGGFRGGISGGVGSVGAGFGRPVVGAFPGVGTGTRPGFGFSYRPGLGMSGARAPNLGGYGGYRHYYGRYYGGGYRRYGRYYGWGNPYYGAVATGLALGGLSYPYSYYDSPYQDTYYGDQCYWTRRRVLDRWGHSIIRRFEVCPY
jgi:hypothetical protein